ncbi:MAG: Amuc_1100 family pilus-like protein [Lentisphaeria bacterium]
MDFVKKNLGLLICGIISVILACVLLVFMVKTAGRMKAQSQKVTEQMTFFDRVAKEGYKLTAEKGAELENLIQAKINFEGAEQFYRGSRDVLANTYAIKPVLPLTSPEALKQINEKIRQMTDFVLQNDIDFPGLAKEFSGIVARGSVSSTEFYPLFRQLLIYDQILKKIAEAGIKEVLQLEWPLGFAIQEEDIYSVTPIWLSVHCDVEVGQTFLNQMTNDTKMLFYIKNVTYNAEDRYAQVVLDYQKANAERNQATTLSSGNNAGEFPGQGGMMMPDGGMAARRSESGRSVGERRNPAVRSLFPTESGDSEATNQSASRSRLIVPDPKRQDFLVFEKKYVTMNVRFDLYEFKKFE